MDALETRNEIINRLMNSMIRGNAAATHSVYNTMFMQKEEIVDWLLLNQGVVHNAIMSPGLINTFIRDISNEMMQSARRMVAMNTLKEHLLERQRQQQQEQQPQPPQSRVVGGGFHRRTKHSKKHSNASRKSRKSKKTKSRRH